MAQKLREHLESVQVAITSEADLLQLQSIVRDRAARAVFQYTTMVKTIDGAAPSNAITNPWHFPPLIRYFKEKSSDLKRQGRPVGPTWRRRCKCWSDRRSSIPSRWSARARRSPASVTTTRRRRSRRSPARSTAGSRARLRRAARRLRPDLESSVRGVVADMKAPEVGTSARVGARGERAADHRRHQGLQYGDERNDAAGQRRRALRSPAGLSR